jgi:hypothetical protein
MRVPFPFVCFPVCMLGVALFVSGCHRHEAQNTFSVQPPPQGASQHPHGLPGVAVHPGPQPFTVADVASYFAAHNLPLNGADASQLHVDALDFITAKQAQDRLQGEATGLDDNEMVGFVTLSGTFIFSGPPKSHSAAFSKAYAIFVASTGRLIMDGSLESPNAGGGNSR